MADEPIGYFLDGNENEDGATGSTGTTGCTGTSGTTGSTGCGEGETHCTRKSKLCLSAEDIAGMSSVLAISLGKGKTRRDLETIVNLFSSTLCILKSMLAQRAINSGSQIEVID